MAVAIWIAAIVLLVLAVRQTRSTHRRVGGVGTAAVGSVYGMLNEERRNAVEIILEERAAARDPEDKDGNLPDLANPKSLP